MYNVPSKTSLAVFQKIVENEYRTRAISGRSRLVAAPLKNRAKSQFLRAFYVII